MWHSWKVQYLISKDGKVEMNRVVIITSDYSFAEAELRFGKLVKNAKRIVNIEYIGEALGIFLDQTI